MVSALSVGVIVIEKKEAVEAVAINWGYVKVNEESVSVLVDGAVALAPGDDSQTAQNIENAKKLVNSVKDSNVALAAVEARIDAFAK